MTDIFSELVTAYGLVILAATVFFAALGAPVPGTALLVLSGAFAASGDMDTTWVALTAFGAAVIGDFTGYFLGLSGGDWLKEKLGRTRFANQVFKAEKLMAKWGGIGIFLSRWLIAPVGPTLNYVAGIGQFGWRRFLLWDSLGEAVWVALYVSIGMVFSATALALVDAIASASWLILGGIGMYLMGMRLLKVARKAKV